VRRGHLRFSWHQLRRAVPFVLADAGIIALSVYLAFLLRFDASLSARYVPVLVRVLLVSLAIKLPTLLLLGMYRFSWSYVGLSEIVNTGIACIGGSLILTALLLLLRDHPAWSLVPRSILGIDFAFCLLGIAGIRLAKRLFRHAIARGSRLSGLPTLIVGAGEAGEQLLRAILRDESAEFRPIGFVDDDAAKIGIQIHGIPVLAPRRRLPEVIRSRHVKAVIIAIPSVSAGVVRETVDLARQGGVQEVKIIPSLSELYTGEVRVSEVRPVRPEDLLGRAPIDIDTSAVRRFLRDKVVLITGAAGSIGAEICRQVLRFGAREAVAMDIDETGLFNLEADIRARLSGASLRVLVGDVRDPKRVSSIFESTRPELVFHAAAYKHVPMMESCPGEAIKTNVFGTRLVADAACHSETTEAFVLISTDKAVNPTSVMGASKRVAETIITRLCPRDTARCMAVRFGNVLGSRGSVLLTFMEQIRRGGPVTVTHPEMKRYFMTTAEAVLLVLQAGAMGRGGEVFVLDMGEPIRILELAREAIRFQGFDPDRDIPIVFSGVRPGEKLFEELLTAEEGTDATEHQRVFVARMTSPWQPAHLEEVLEELRLAAVAEDRNAIVTSLGRLIPTYRSPSSAGH